VIKAGVTVVALTVLLAGCLGSSEQRGTTGDLPTPSSRAPQPEPVEDSCPLTPPNGRIPPGETSSPGSRYLGNGALFTDLYPTPIHPRPDDVRDDGAIEMKVPWWRGVPGRLTIEGRRLDATAVPLTAWIPTGYGREGFQSTAITFPTPGCWEVTGRVANASLTFVTLILEPAR
jgi:hypothetical protein